MFHCSTHLCLNLINKHNCAWYFTSPFLHVFGVWTFGMWTLFFVMNNLFFTWEKLMNSVQTSLPSPPLGINNSCSSIIQIHVALYVYGKTFSLLLASITLALWFFFFFWCRNSPCGSLDWSGYLLSWKLIIIVAPLYKSPCGLFLSFLLVGCYVGSHESCRT